MEVISLLFFAIIVANKKRPFKIGTNFFYVQITNINFQVVISRFLNGDAFPVLTRANTHFHSRIKPSYKVTATDRRNLL